MLRPDDPCLPLSQAHQYINTLQENLQLNSAEPADLQSGKTHHITRQSKIADFVSGVQPTASTLSSHNAIRDAQKFRKFRHRHTVNTILCTSPRGEVTIVISNEHMCTIIFCVTSARSGHLPKQVSSVTDGPVQWLSVNC